MTMNMYGCKPKRRALAFRHFLRRRWLLRLRSPDAAARANRPAK